VTQRELDQSGSITAAFEDKLLLTVHDRAYARFANAAAQVKVGESYVLYRTERPVRHPVTGDLFGYKSSIIGAARVVAIEPKAVTVEITQAFEPIERGALVGPWVDRLVKHVQRRPNQRQLAGFIIASQQDLVSEIGEHHVVFVDKGRADGRQCRMRAGEQGLQHRSRTGIPERHLVPQRRPPREEALYLPSAIHRAQVFGNGGNPVAFFNPQLTGIGDFKSTHRLGPQNREDGDLVNQGGCFLSADGRHPLPEHILAVADSQVSPRLTGLFGFVFDGDIQSSAHQVTQQFPTPPVQPHCGKPEVRAGDQSCGDEEESGSGKIPGD
jgi:hypothetical protein